MAEVDLKTIKNYLRLDEDDHTEDDLIKDLVTAGEDYLLAAGIEKAYHDGRYQLAIKRYVLHAYDNRGEPIGDKLTELILSLQLSRPKAVEEGDHG